MTQTELYALYAFFVFLLENYAFIIFIILTKTLL